MTKRITDIEKQAVTIHMRIDELIRDDHRWNNLTWAKVKIVKKMARKFLENIKGTHYMEKTDHYGDPVYKIIEINLKSEEDYPAGYLTWISFGFHHFIHNFCQDYDPREKYNDRKIQRFYKKTLEVLTR